MLAGDHNISNSIQKKHEYPSLHSSALHMKIRMHDFFVPFCFRTNYVNEIQNWHKIILPTLTISEQIHTMIITPPSLYWSNWSEDLISGSLFCWSSKSSNSCLVDLGFQYIAWRISWTLPRQNPVPFGNYEQ